MTTEPETENSHRKHFWSLKNQLKKQTMHLKLSELTDKSDLKNSSTSKAWATCIYSPGLSFMKMIIFLLDGNNAPAK